MPQGSFEILDSWRMVIQCGDLCAALQSAAICALHCRVRDVCAVLPNPGFIPPRAGIPRGEIKIFLKSPNAR